MATHLKRIAAYVEPDTWQEFRAICLQHHISASKQLARMIDAQMAAWGIAVDKETTPWMTLAKNAPSPEETP